MQPHKSETIDEHSTTPRASRRDVLRRVVAGAGVVALSSLAPAAARGTDTDTESSADTLAIPAPFDEVPTIDDPMDEFRELATGRFPPEAVPDEGPIPDFHHHHTVERAITVPAWGIEATRWRLRHTDRDELDRWRVEEFLMEYAYISERFITPDGRDAVAVLLEDAGGDR
jgi:hypothetical protein